MTKFHVYCDLPNCSDSLNGVAFTEHTPAPDAHTPRVMRTIEPVGIEVAAMFKGIPGFTIEDAEPAPAVPAPVPPPPAARTPRRQAAAPPPTQVEPVAQADEPEQVKDEAEDDKPAEEAEKLAGESEADGDEKSPAKPEEEVF